MEEVNHDKRQRGYGAQDKDELIIMITKLHEEGFSQVAIAKNLGSLEELSYGGIKNLNFSNLELLEKLGN